MQNLFTPSKFVVGSLGGLGDNIFAHIGHFKKLATRAKWSEEDIEKVIAAGKATGDFYHCYAVLSAHFTEAVVEPKPTAVKLTNDEIDDLLEKIDVLVEKFKNTSNTIDQDGDSKGKLMETKHGELALAVCHLAYEFHNNGHYFYGTDTNDTGSHAEFLIAHGSSDVERLVSEVAKNPNFDNETYSQFLGRLAKLVLDNIENSEDGANPCQKHWQHYTGRWQLSLCECCGDVTGPWEDCECDDEDDEDNEDED